MFDGGAGEYWTRTVPTKAPPHATPPPTHAPGQRAFVAVLASNPEAFTDEYFDLQHPAMGKQYGELNNEDLSAI